MSDSKNVFTVDIGISDREKSLIERLSVDADLPQFDYYGRNIHELKEQVELFLMGVGSNPPDVLNAVISVLSKAMTTMLDKYGCDTAWVVLRASLPHSGFDIPRWHRDGRYFKSRKKVYKRVLTLKGAESRFARVIDEELFRQLEREQMRDDLSNEEEEILRTRVETTVKEIFPCRNSLEVVEFLVGEADAGVHSEPPIKEPRLFCSILVGSGKQIAEWQSR